MCERDEPGRLPDGAGAPADPGGAPGASGSSTSDGADGAVQRGCRPVAPTGQGREAVVQALARFVDGLVDAGSGGEAGEGDGREDDGSR